MTPRRAWIGTAIIVVLSVVRVAATHRVFAQTAHRQVVRLYHLD